MKKWKRGLRKLTAVALAVMMVGTTVDFSAFAVSAAEGGSIECICETDDPAFHATNCPAYIAPENPQCYCAEKCTEDTLNVWCDVCGVQGVSACQGEDTSGTYGAEGNESSVTAFATPEQLMSSDNFALHTDTGSGTAQKVYFGTNGNSQQTWYIAGSDADNSIVLLCDPMLPMTTGCFDDKSDLVDDDYKTYDNEWNCTYGTAPSRVYANHYGASDLRLITLSSLESSAFSTSEQDMMLATKVYTDDDMLRDEHNSEYTYYTTDKLYAAYGVYDEAIITVGENSADSLNSGLKVSLTSGPYTNDEATKFYLRTPYLQQKRSVHNVSPAKDEVGMVSVKMATTPYAVVPAFRLNLSSVLFASAAPAATSDASLTDTMTFRVGDTEKIKSKAAYATCGVTVNYDEGDGNVFLYVQDADSVYSVKITEDTIVALSDMTGINNLTDENTKIWLEKSEDNVAYAVMAEALLTEHIPNADDGDCTTAITCSSCGTVTTEAKEKHIDDNGDGICDHCDSYAEPKQEDEYYQIANANNLMWFAEQVNEGQTAISAKLTADIAMNGIDWTIMSSFAGTFDGNGYTISGLNGHKADTGDTHGFIRTLADGGVVKNLTFTEADIWNHEGSGAISAVIVYTNNGTVENCVVKSSLIQHGNYDALGVVVGVNGGTIRNCASISNTMTRRFSSAKDICGFVWSNSGSIENCFNYDCTYQNGSNRYAFTQSNTGTITNCYYYESSETISDTVATAKIADQFAGGEVAYLLNGSSSENVTWYQTLGTDTYPVLDSEHGKVYSVFKCDGTTPVYRNVNENEPHTDVNPVNSVCDECGANLHTHEWTYTANDDTITAVCGADDCPLDGAKTIVISASDKTYDGTAVVATVENNVDTTDYSSSIVYKNSEGDVVTEAVNAGTYTANLTLTSADSTEVTASVEFTIAKVTPDIGTVSASNMENTLDVSQVVLSRSNETVPGTLSLAEGTTLQYGIHDYTYVFTPNDNTNYETVTGTVSITISDTNVPTATYKVGTDGWKQFINTITFGHFCKDYTIVDITYSDEGSGVAYKQYYISDVEITNTENIQWSDYTDTLNINATGKYYIYVRVTDNYGNVVIQNSEGIVVYAESVITPTSFSCEYGEENALFVNITTNGNTFANLTDGSGNEIATENYSIDGSTLTIKGEYLSDLDVGEYTYKICMNPQGVENTEVTEVTLAYSFVVKVTAKELTVTADNASKTYGEDEPPFTYTATGLKVGDTLTGTLSRETGENVGTYAITQGTLTNENNPNYDITFVEGTFTINKATPPELTIPTATTITYGEKLSASTLSDGWAWVDGTIVPNASAYYNAYIEVDDSNYDYTGVDGYDDVNHRVVRGVVVSISRATLTITANSYTIKVGSALPTYKYTVTGLVNGDTLPFNVSLSCSATDSNAVGTYPITISGVVSDTQLASRYVPNYVKGELTITEKDIQEITADDITLTYGETGKKIAATTSGDGAISYSTTSDVISVAADGTITALKAGTATVTITAAETADYAEATKTISVTVNKVGAEVTAAPTPIADLEYDGTAQNLINAGTTTDGEMQYSLDGTNYSSAIPTGTDAKTYTVWYKVDGDENHNDTTPASIEVTIAKGTPDIGTVSASNMENTLDVSQVVLSRSNETVSGTLSLAEGTTLQYGIHDYTYVFKSGDANYNDVEGTVSITILDTIAPTATYKVGTDGWKQFINTITFGHFCKDYTTVDITYSDEGSGVADKQYYISEEEITNTENIQWSKYTDTLNINATGKYYIYVKVTDKGGNKVIRNSEGIVVYAESVITPTSFAFEYGEENDLSVNITTNGNTFANLTDGSGNEIATDNYSIDGSTLTIKGEYLSDLDVGEYTYKICMNPQGVENTEVTLAYSFVVNVTAKELTVTGATATSRDYIANDKTVDITGITLNGIVNEDNVSVVLNGLKGALSSANADTYTTVILPTLTLTGEDARNYVLSQSSGEVTLASSVVIDKADAEITVGTTEYNKTFGNPNFTLDVTDNNPEADVTYLSSDVNVVTVSNGTVTIKGVGTATITVSMAASTNYNAVESKEITITVNKATAQSLAKGSKSYVYTESKTGETVTITGIPEDCGTVTYELAVTDEKLMLENNSVSNGVLTYDVKALDTYTEGVSATIKVTIKMQNYNDLTYTYTITRSNCDHTEGKVVWDGNVATDKAPTCTEAGIGHTTCTKAGCGEVVETGITVPALGHDYESKVTTEATYTAEGVRTYTCKRSECGHSYTESIPKLTKPSGSGSSSSTTNPPTTEEPSTENPSTENPSTEDSSTETPSTEKPGTSEEDTVKWKTDENGTFYEKEDGTKAIGWYEMAEDVWYYFDENGYRQTGWEKDGENWYYLNENGVMQTGWQKDGESWYYLSENGAMKTGWQKDGESWYYLSESGAMKTGWQKDGESWYYLSESGAMKTGWQKDGESWYYLSESGAMKTGWQKDGESWYYLSESGAMKTGWQKDGESWYYLNESGAMKTGWVKDGETWYYLSESGAMKTGWVQIGADWFYLNSNGSMAANTYIGKWYVDKNGYYIPSKTK